VYCIILKNPPSPDFGVTWWKNIIGGRAKRWKMLKIGKRSCKEGKWKLKWQNKYKRGHIKGLRGALQEVFASQEGKNIILLRRAGGL
jgi:hypothetical protein